MQAIATFAAGCFWGVEANFRKLIGQGVVDTQVGYTGGHLENPTYRLVCRGDSGHAEAVQVQFDPQQISYDELVHHFFNIHNPTQADGQGPDIGSQYRSAIFFHDEQQSQIAAEIKQALESSGEYDYHIVTEIVAATQFYPAEEYHQRYFDKQGGHCRY